MCYQSRFYFHSYAIDGCAQTYLQVLQRSSTLSTTSFSVHSILVRTINKLMVDNRCQCSGNNCRIAIMNRYIKRIHQCLNGASIAMKHSRDSCSSFSFGTIIVKLIGHLPRHNDFASQTFWKEKLWETSKRKTQTIQTSTT